MLSNIMIFATTGGNATGAGSIESTSSGNWVIMLGILISAVILIAFGYLMIRLRSRIIDTVEGFTDNIINRFIASDSSGIGGGVSSTVSSSGSGSSSGGTTSSASSASGGSSVGGSAGKVIAGVAASGAGSSVLTGMINRWANNNSDEDSERQLVNDYDDVETKDASSESSNENSNEESVRSESSVKEGETEMASNIGGSRADVSSSEQGGDLNTQRQEGPREGGRGEQSQGVPSESMENSVSRDRDEYKQGENMMNQNSLADGRRGPEAVTPEGVDGAVSYGSSGATPEEAGEYMHNIKADETGVPESVGTGAPNTEDVSMRNVRSDEAGQPGVGGYGTAGQPGQNGAGQPGQTGMGQVGQQGQAGKAGSGDVSAQKLVASADAGQTPKSTASESVSGQQQVPSGEMERVSKQLHGVGQGVSNANGPQSGKAASGEATSVSGTTMADRTGAKPGEFNPEDYRNGAVPNKPVEGDASAPSNTPDTGMPNVSAPMSAGADVEPAMLKRVKQDDSTPSERV